jgi:hypothetical protein
MKIDIFMRDRCASLTTRSSVFETRKRGGGEFFSWPKRLSREDGGID